MYCADNGRYYETPISWYGLARQFGYASWHQSALFFKRNVLAGCFIPHKLLSRRRLVRSRLTGLCSAMRTLRCAATACMGQWVFVTHWRSTPGAVPTSTLTGLFSPGLPITSSRLVQCVMCSTRTSTGSTACRSISPACCRPTRTLCRQVPQALLRQRVARRLHCLR